MKINKQELSTCDKSYYKWTQHIFLQLYEKGIIFQKEVIMKRKRYFSDNLKVLFIFFHSQGVSELGPRR